MPDDPETRAPLVDLVELLALVVVPAAILGVVLTVIGGTGNLVPGLAIGGLFGTILAGLRRGFYAVRTANGIERRLRPGGENAGENPWVRLASVEYDERYDRVLAVVLAVVGIAAFAAIPFVDRDGWVLIRLVAVGLFGLASSLLVLGLLQSRD